jgi:hypothetical protein
LADVILYSISQPLIERAGSGRQVGQPTCHGDNEYIARGKESIQWSASL